MHIIASNGRYLTAESGGGLNGDPARGPARVHARAEQRLVGVDIAHARDPPLVEQERLDRRAPPARERAQVRNGETLVERLEAETRREELLERVVADQQLAGAEAAGIGDDQPRARFQLDANARVRRLGVGVPEQRPRHA